jgi:hypothetical protein
MINFLNWLFGKFGYKLIKIEQPSELETLTREFVSQLNEDRFNDQSGEWKRNQVTRMLMNRLPDIPHRDIGWMIEHVLRS